jgi:hypothetical protein
MSNKYGREIKCSRCWTPWFGWGTVCNECRQIEVLGAISSKSQQVQRSSGINSVSAAYTPIFSCFIWGFILILNLIFDWWPFKIIWIGLKAMVFFSVGWWVGMEW